MTHGIVLLLITTRAKVNSQGVEKSFDNVCFVKLLHTYDVNTIVEKEQRLYTSYDVKLIAAWAGYDTKKMIEKSLNDKYGVAIKTRYNGSIVTEKALICNFGVIDDFRTMCSGINSNTDYFEAGADEINGFVNGKNIVDSTNYCLNKICNSKPMMFMF